MGEAVNLLCFGIGNCSRGDDGLGPGLLHALANDETPSNNSLFKLQLEEVFQLQPEHIYEFKHQDVILFLDADSRFSAGFKFSGLTANDIDNPFVSHALAPEKLLAMHKSLTNDPTPVAYLLSMGTENIELGESLSRQGQENLSKALSFMKELMNTPPERWNQFTN